METPAIDSHRGQIFLLYIVQKKTLAQVQEILKDQHAIDIPYASPPSHPPRPYRASLRALADS